jgi:hypothetical protein
MHPLSQLPFGQKGKEFTMITLVIQIAGLAIGVGFLMYLIGQIKSEKDANKTLLTTVAVLGFSVFIAAEVLTLGVDNTGKLTGGGLLWTLYQLLIKVFGSAAAKITYTVPQFAQVYVAPKIARAAEVVVQMFGQTKFYFVA